MSRWSIAEGDCVEVMSGMGGHSVDAVVTDPPYGIGFMGREWDTFDPDQVERRRQSRSRKNTKRVSDRWPTKVGSVQGGTHVSYDESADGNARFQAWSLTWAAAAARVLKPGGHLVAFGGPRTFHRLAVALELVGFELRDCLAWLFGQGFPKSRNLGDGWGTGLKPAWEPILLARAPLSGRAVAVNHRDHGTGGLNIDGCRLPVDDAEYARNASGDRGHGGTRELEERGATDLRAGGGSAHQAGRWPPNVMLDAAAAAMLDEQTGPQKSGGTRPGTATGRFAGEENPDGIGSTAGPVSRFFYCAKADRSEREVGMDAFDERPLLWSSGEQSPGTFQSPGTNRSARNHHPTVKPIAVMRWLCRLVTPPGGLVLDPFVGSGTTGIAALAEGFRFVGIEREAEYVAIARARISAGAPELDGAEVRP